MKRKYRPIASQVTLVLQTPVTRHSIPDPPIASYPVLHVMGTKLP